MLDRLVGRRRRGPPDCLRREGYTKPVIVYTGSVDDAEALVQFVRRETAKLRSLRKLIISPEKTVVRDVNGDTMEFPGLTYGRATLDILMQELGVIYTPQTLHQPPPTAGGVKEFRLSARHPWGHDRVM